MGLHSAPGSVRGGRVMSLAFLCSLRRRCWHLESCCRGSIGSIGSVDGVDWVGASMNVGGRVVGVTKSWKGEVLGLRA